VAHHRRHQRSWGSVTSLLDQQAGLETFARKGYYNDPDMLEVGNGPLTADENVAHFSLWALLSSPLLLGNDLRSVSSATLSVLLRNSEVIAVNQDWGGSQGRQISDAGDTEVWAKPLSDGSTAVVLFNRGATTATVATSAATLASAVRAPTRCAISGTGATSTIDGAVAASVPSHGVVMYRVTRSGTLAAGLGAGTYQVSDLPWLASSKRVGTGRSATAPTASRPRATAPPSRSAARRSRKASGSMRIRRFSFIWDARAGRSASPSESTVRWAQMDRPRFQVYGDGKLLAYTDVKSGGRPRRD
jgi:alpha-galactosidase